MDECKKLATQEELDKLRAQVVEQKRVIYALLQRVQSLENSSNDYIKKTDELVVDVTDAIKTAVGFNNGYNPN